MKKILLAFFLSLNLGSFAQVKKAEDASETFVGRSLNELDRFAVNIGEEIKDLFRKKRDYKLRLIWYKQLLRIHQMLN